MKNIYSFIYIALFSILFISCEDESLSPLPVKVEGNFVKIDIKSRQLDFNNINSTYFGGPISIASGDVVKLEMFVVRYSASGVALTELVPFKTITSFPFDFKVTPNDLAVAFGVNVSDLQDGEFYRFINFSYDSNGKKTSYLNLSRQVQVSYALQHAYRFNTEMSNDPIDTTDPTLTQYNNYQ